MVEGTTSDSLFDLLVKDLAKCAGPRGAKADRPDLGPYARVAGLPDDLVSVFSGPGYGQLLLATK